MEKLIYKRILLKLSGEALQGEQANGLDIPAVDKVCQDIAELVQLGVQVGLVIGGGNFLRGAQFTKEGLDRVTCDHMGMLATIMNGLALRDRLLAMGVPTVLMSSVKVPSVAGQYNRRRAVSALERGKVVIFSGGTGNPLFSTDSAASLRGIEINADLILKATKVDGVYSDDPMKNPKAEKFEKLTYQAVLDRELGVMDLPAIYLCQEAGVKIRVFNMNKPDVIKKIVMGEEEGTLVY